MTVLAVCLLIVAVLLALAAFGGLEWSSRDGSGDDQEGGDVGV